MERGEAALQELIDALGDDYAPVRFWGAAGLANLGERAAPAVDTLLNALRDPEPEVAITAAEALCYAGHAGPALPVIVRYLRDDRQYVAIAAANVADRIGEQARPIREVMEAVIKTSAERSTDRTNLSTRYFLFVDWLLTHALRELDASES
jgi:HEAT repeat protein